MVPVLTAETLLYAGCGVGGGVFGGASKPIHQHVVRPPTRGNGGGSGGEESVIMIMG